MIDPKDLQIEPWPEPPAHGMITGTPPVGVKVTHLPTGAVATCDSERSQHLNRTAALAELEVRLWPLRAEAFEDQRSSANTFRLYADGAQFQADSAEEAFSRLSLYFSLLAAGKRALAGELLSLEQGSIGLSALAPARKTDTERAQQREEGAS